jgi:hypothetical protein
MPLGTALPFGLREVKLTPLMADGTPDTTKIQKLPASRTFSFKETEDFTELQGDDSTIASHGAGPIVEFDLEGGGISLEIWAILSGATITSSGTTPAQVKTLTKLNTDSRPYFQVEGRAVSDSGGDFHMEVYRCKADGDLEAELNNGDFLLTKCGGKGYGNLDDHKLYDFVQNETPVPLTYS